MNHQLIQLMLIKFRSNPSTENRTTLSHDIETVNLLVDKYGSVIRLDQWNQYVGCPEFYHDICNFSFEAVSID